MPTARRLDTVLDKLMTPAEARSTFPALAKLAYLNAGSVGPLSLPTLEAMRAEYAKALERGRGSASAFNEFFVVATGLRERLAALLGVPVENMVPTASTTEGCNIVVTGLRLGPEDEVVTTDAEHPGLLRPLIASGARIRQARVMGRSAAEALDAVLAEVTPSTRLVALSHVLWLNGHVLPLAAIKEATGLPLLVDGAQAVGAIPVDARVSDYYAFSGQKWLCGPEATGGLYVANPNSLQPRMQGFAAEVAKDALRLAVSFTPTASLAGLAAALEQVPEWGFARAADLASRCWEILIESGVEVRTEPGQGTLISFRLAGDPVAITLQAERRGVIIRNLPDGWQRASVGWWNDQDDLERLGTVVRELSLAPPR